MTIHDADVGNTTQVGSAIVTLLYYLLDTTSVLVSANMSQNADKVIFLDSTSSLSAILTPVLLTPIYINTSNNIAVDSGISFQKDINLSLGSTVITFAAMDEFIDISSRLCGYTPAILGDTDMPATITRFVVDTMTLKAGTYTLELPKPTFGNEDNLSVTIHSQETSSGGIVISPLTDTSVLSKTYIFEDVCLEKKQEYMSFTQTVTGYLTEMVDFEGNTTNIIITNTDQDITETDIGFDIQMDFEEV